MNSSNLAVYVPTTTTGEPALTVGGTGYYEPFYTNYYWWTTPVIEPTSCIGKAHVFACDHEPKCLCGLIRRVMPRAKAKQR